MPQLEDLAVKLKVTFKNTDLIKQAFVHRSYLNETNKPAKSNERLEFLGDSILSFLVSNHLYKKFPDLPEGELTNLRSSIVKTSTLANVAMSLSLGDYLLLSKGEEAGGGRNNISLLADTFEAMLGAIYCDQNLASVKKILEKYLFPLLSDVIKNRTYKDAKSSFQELIQENSKISPVYKVIEESGPDHAKKFTIGVYVNNIIWGKGSGKSKQIAETQAATDALEKWNKVRYNKTSNI